MVITRSMAMEGKAAPLLQPDSSEVIPTQRASGGAAVSMKGGAAQSIAPSVRSDCSSVRIQKAEARKKALDDLAKFKISVMEETLLKKLEIDEQVLEEEWLEKEETVTNKNDNNTSVATWLEAQEAQCTSKAPPPPPPPLTKEPSQVRHATSNSCNALPPVLVPNSQPSDIEKLAGAITQSLSLSRQPELPIFSGKASEWMAFKAAYYSGVKRSAAENVSRLRLCLKSEAKEAVQSLLICNSDPEEIISMLELRFGNENLLISDQLQTIYNLCPINDSCSDSLLTFTSKVCNCVATMRSLKKFEHLHNIQLYSAIVNKLTSILKSKWFDYANTVSSSEPLLVLLSQFLRLEAEKQIKFSANYSVVPSFNAAASSSGRSRSVWKPDSSCSAPQQRWNSAAAAAPPLRPSPEAYVQRAQPAAPPLPPLSQGAQLPSHSQPPRYPVNNIGTGTKLLCLFCDQRDHNLAKCPEFSAKPLEERWSFVKDNRRCYRCLVFSHPARNCRISKYLHKLLRKEPTCEANALSSNTETANNVHVTSSKAFLKIVPVTVSGQQSIETFALLDEGATISLIESKLAEELGLEGPSQSLRLDGVCTSHAVNSKCVGFSIRGSKQEESFEITARTIDNLHLSPQYIEKSAFDQYTHIQQVAGCIDWYKDAVPRLLIGQDNWSLIVTRELLAGKNNEPAASKTALGWVLHGCLPYQSQYKVFNKVLHLSFNSESKEDSDDLCSLIKKSFELDSIGILPKQRLNPVEERAKHILEVTTNKTSSGQWETGLLWQSDDVVLPNNKGLALKRFYNLEKKLKLNPDLQEGYAKQIHNLFNEDFAEPSDGKEELSWYLPHFAIVNPNKPGKVRVVFDAASKAQGICLNDKLLKGPDLLQNLLGVLFKFRLKPIAMCADIKDMFLRIKIIKKDQGVQKFLWRDPGDSGPPKEYKMTSMLFGAACSPCSAIYTLNANAKLFKDEFPEAVHAIEKKHYMDDYLDSCNSAKEAVDMAKSVMFVHSQGGFDIRRWASNSKAVLDSIPEEKRAHEVIDLSPESAIKEKTLGMYWEPATDTLSFNLSMHRVPHEVATCQELPTKRQMLSVIMSIFDPFGLLSFLTICGKILLQEVWRTSIGWDDKLQDREFKKWQNFIKHLNAIKSCKVPRCYVSRSEIPMALELHTFCDASQKAYCAACYFRFIYCNGEIKTVLVAAKSRVTPLKPISVPRLELQSALLGARLANFVISEHEIKVNERFFWTDSVTTMAWIRSDPRNYKAFVGHRLSAIDELTSVSEWRWVPTKENVADMATRDTGDYSKSWFLGPSFLKKQKEFWPVESKINIESIKDGSVVCEERVNVISSNYEAPLPDINKFSSWRRLIRASAYVLLFINKCRNTGDSSLTPDLLKSAELLWVKKVQHDSFSKDLSLIKNNLPLTGSSLLELCPFIDSEGILRARGRFDLTPNVQDSTKRPIILDHSHYYTKLLIFHYHKQYHHGSTETVVNEMKQLYWICKLRSTVRLVAHKCQYCKIKRAVPTSPLMGDLPLARLDHHKRPFTHCGLDYFGPLDVSIGRRREKRYGALFTCMVTRAVHIELAASLTTDDVIMAIRRMASRRGCPTDIYSDNGSNFRGAEGELRKAFKDLDCNIIQQDMTNRNIRWHFLPANAPSMAGSWERMVQAIKKALYATLHERAPSVEVLSTLLAEAEHSVNSRPLCHVSVDSRDSETLTPNHFLIGSSSGVPIPGKFDDKDLLLRKKWRVAQRLADMFWQRWLKEYLPSLLSRTKQPDSQRDLRVGDLVIIVDSSLARNVWPRGIITSVFPGNDGRVRVVEVKTVGGLFRRPSNKVICLPTESDPL